jgi:hypothetical protein
MRAGGPRIPGRAIWGVAALTVTVHLIMVLRSLPNPAEMAGGLPPFDLRPTGSGPDDARAFLAALIAGGRTFYLGVQHRLDTVAPGLLALTLVLVFCRLAPGWPAFLLGFVAVDGAVADGSENASVAAVLASTDPTEAQLVRASQLSLAKFVLTPLAVTAPFRLFVRAGVRRWRR